MRTDLTADDLMVAAILLWRHKDSNSSGDKRQCVRVVQRIRNTLAQVITNNAISTPSTAGPTAVG